MGLSKRDLTRKKKSLESKIEELEVKAKRNPKDKNIQNEINDLKKKLDKQWNNAIIRICNFRILFENKEFAIIFLRDKPYSN